VWQRSDAQRISLATPGARSALTCEAG
jgi:hypothetical protein